MCVVFFLKFTPPYEFAAVANAAVVQVPSRGHGSSLSPLHTSPAAYRCQPPPSSCWLHLFRFQSRRRECDVHSCAHMATDIHTHTYTYINTHTPFLQSVYTSPAGVRVLGHSRVSSAHALHFALHATLTGLGCATPDYRGTR